MKKIILCSLFFMISLLVVSCDEVLMEDDLTNDQVTLIAPINNAEFSSTSIAFSWAAVEGASNYRLQIARPNFENPIQIVLDTLVATTTYAAQLNVGSYEWRVKAVNSAYETPYKNRFLTIANNEDFQNNVVNQISPAASLITNVSLQNLSWQPVIGATGYQVQVFDSTNAIVYDQNVTGTNLNYTFTQGHFQWKVRATNGTLQTLYSSRSILVDTAAPSTPVLSNPLNASTQAAGDVNFQWSRTAIEGSVEKDKIYIYTDSALTNLYSQTETESPYTVALPAGTYCWYVKSYDFAGNNGAQSTVFSFTLN